MASTIDSIVSVDITIQQDTVTRTGFGTPAIIVAVAAGYLEAPFDAATGTYAVFNDLPGIVEWLKDDPVTADSIGGRSINVATRLFSGNVKPEKVVIGRIGATGTVAADVAADLSTLREAYGDWYAFEIISDAGTLVPGDMTSLQKTFIENASKWAETNPVIQFATYHGSTVAGGVNLATAIGKVDRTVLLFANANHMSEGEALSWFCESASFDPGSSNYAFKDIPGATTISRSSADTTSIFAVKGNTFETIAGADVTRWGTVLSGEYIDVIIGIDWLRAKIREDIMSLMVTQRKISMDDVGIQKVASVVAAATTMAEDRSILVAGKTQLTIPKYASLDAADKQARRLRGIKFVGKLAGAVNHTDIVGNVSV